MSIAVEHGRFQLPANSKREVILLSTESARKPQSTAGPAEGNS